MRMFKAPHTLAHAYRTPCMQKQYGLKDLKFRLTLVFTRPLSRF